MYKALTVLMGLIPLFPLLAWLTMRLVGQGKRLEWLAVIGTGLSCAASVGVAVLLSNPAWIPQSANRWQLYRWLFIPGEPSLQIGMGVRVDALSAFFLLLITFVGTVVGLQALSRISDKKSRLVFFRGFSLLMFAAIMVMLSENFLELFFFWELTAWAGFLLIQQNCSPYNSGLDRSVRSNLLTSGLLPDALLLAGVLFVWMNFGSLGFDNVLSERSIAEVLEGNRQAPAAVSLTIVIAAGVRCAQFPFFRWLDDSAESSSLVHALLLAVFIPTGIYLLARSAPLLEVSVQVRGLMALAGGLTALLSALVALVETNGKRIGGYLTSSLLGFAWIGLSLGTLQGRSAALFLIVTVAGLMTVLVLATGDKTAKDDIERAEGTENILPLPPFTRVVLLIASLVLVSGIGGQAAVLTNFWETNNREVESPVATEANSPQVHPASLKTAVTSKEKEFSESGNDFQRILPILLGSSVAALFLQATAVSRACFKLFAYQKKTEAEPEENSTTRSQFACRALIVLTLSAICVAPVLGIPGYGLSRFLERSFGQTKQLQEFDIGTSGLVLCLGLMGWLWGRHLGISEKKFPAWLNRAFSPFARLARNRFYVGHMSSFLLLLMRGIVEMCRFFDRFLLERLGLGAVTRMPLLLGKLARPLQNGLVQFYALAVVLTVGLLLLLLLLGR